MEKECKICKVIRPFKDYYSCLQCSDGKLGVCKICKKAGKTLRELNPKEHKFNVKWSKRDDIFMRMSMVTKEDYLLMYEFLKGCGYDTTKDIAQQFIDKWNVEVKKKPMKYKKRSSNSINTYLWNGEPNPEYKKFKVKENPTD